MEALGVGRRRLASTQVRPRREKSGGGIPPPLFSFPLPLDTSLDLCPEASIQPRGPFPRASSRAAASPPWLRPPCQRGGAPTTRTRAADSLDCRRPLFLRSRAPRAARPRTVAATNQFIIIMRTRSSGKQAVDSIGTAAAMDLNDGSAASSTRSSDRAAAPAARPTARTDGRGCQKRGRSGGDGGGDASSTKSSRRRSCQASSRAEAGTPAAANAEHGAAVNADATPRCDGSAGASDAQNDAAPAAPAREGVDGAHGAEARTRRADGDAEAASASESESEGGDADGGKGGDASGSAIGSEGGGARDGEGGASDVSGGVESLDMYTAVIDLAVRSPPLCKTTSRHTTRAREMAMQCFSAAEPMAELRNLLERIQRSEQEQEEMERRSLAEQQAVLRAEDALGELLNEEAAADDWAESLKALAELAESECGCSVIMKLAWNGPTYDVVVNPDGSVSTIKESFRPATVATLEDGGSLAILLSFARGNHSEELRQLAHDVLARLEERNPDARAVLGELETLPPADASDATAGESNTTFECPVCYDECDPNCCRVTFGCRHAFCSACVQSLIEYSSRCPLCRAYIKRWQWGAEADLEEAGLEDASDDCESDHDDPESDLDSPESDHDGPESNDELNSLTREELLQRERDREAQDALERLRRVRARQQTRLINAESTRREEQERRQAAQERAAQQAEERRRRIQIRTGAEVRFGGGGGVVEADAASAANASIASAAAVAESPQTAAAVAGTDASAPTDAIAEAAPAAAAPTASAENANAAIEPPLAVIAAGVDVMYRDRHGEKHRARVGSGRFEARRVLHGNSTYLGSFATAQEAAVAHARHAQSPPRKLVRAHAPSSVPPCEHAATAAPAYAPPPWHMRVLCCPHRTFTLRRVLRASRASWTPMMRRRARTMPKVMRAARGEKRRRTRRRTRLTTTARTRMILIFWAGWHLSERTRTTRRRRRTLLTTTTSHRRASWCALVRPQACILACMPPQPPPHAHRLGAHASFARMVLSLPGACCARAGHHGRR